MHPQEAGKRRRAETIQVNHQEPLANNLDHHSARTSKSNQDKLINHKSKRDRRDRKDNTVETK